MELGTALGEVLVVEELPMPRPRGSRRIRFRSNGLFYKPQGIPLNELSVVELTHEEVEALRLKNVEDLDQKSAAALMETSQSTFQRILVSAQKKVSFAIVNRMAIKVVE